MSAIGTRQLTLTIGGDEVSTEVSSATITSAEGKADFVSFADAAAGGAREYGLKLKFVQDAESSSLWSQVWAANGTDVLALIRPYGNAIPSTTQPHFSGTVTISEPDGDYLGGDADPSTSARFVTEVTWIYLAKPVKVTT